MRLHGNLLSAAGTDRYHEYVIICSREVVDSNNNIFCPLDGREKDAFVPRGSFGGCQPKSLKTCPFCFSPMHAPIVRLDDLVAPIHHSILISVR
jgi:hypothetical protein